MNCPHCGKPTLKNAQYCKHCGAALGQETPEIPETLRRNLREYFLTGRRPLLLVVLGFVAIAVALGGIFLVLNFKRSQDYNRAVSQMRLAATVEDYSEASQLLMKVGDYRDAQTLLAESYRWEQYLRGKSCMERGLYEEALQNLEAIPAFEDASDLITECQRQQVLLEALSYREKGNYEMALELYRQAGDSAMVRECEQIRDYDTAKDLLKVKNYREAAELLDQLGAYRDSVALLMEARYGLAQQALDTGAYYTAYELFSQLSGYADAAEKALSCCPERPVSGQLFRLTDMTCDVRVYIEVPAEDMQDTFVKFYWPDGSLVASAYVRSGTSTSLVVPSGQYMIRQGYGRTWFGPEDAFGDQGHYEILYPGENPVQLDAGGEYTLRLRDAEDGNLEERECTREGF